MSKNVLVKQTGPTVFQSVGPTGTRPSFMDMARTTFAPRDGRVTGGQRAMGALGMLGKVGAAAATAQQTAERMQAGDASAPLQAGITYQGLDPTGTINPNIGEDLARRNTPQRVGVTPVPLPETNTVPLPAPSPAMQEIEAQKAQAPNQVPNNTTQTQSPTTPQNPFTQNITDFMQQQQPQPQQMVGQNNSNAVPPGPRGPDGMLIPEYDPNALAQSSSNFIQGSIKNASFVEVLFDKLGPDMVYKMTPHEIGAVSALMYLKLS